MSGHVAREMSRRSHRSERALGATGRTRYVIRYRVVRFGVTGAFLVAAGAGDARAQGVHVELYRTWSAPDVTVVHGVLSIDPTVVRDGFQCSYLLGITVTDSTGLDILRDRWNGQARCLGAVPALGAADIIETFQFAVVPGRYRISVSVEPAGKPERASQRTLEFRSLAGEAEPSDLILGSGIGKVGAGSEDVAWTIRHHSVGILTSGQPVVYAAEPKLAYYVEVYAEPGSDVQARARGVIRDPKGGELTSIALPDVTLTDGFAAMAGSVSLAGLPPGTYEMEVGVRLPDRVVVRTADFRVEEGAPLAATAVEEADSRRLSSGYFWSLTDAELQAFFDPLVVWLQTDSERKVYEAMSPDAKRRFLLSYFGDSRPTPQDGDDSPLDAFLARVRHISEQFRERAGRGGQEPWRTDRGRVYLLRGEPDQVVDQPNPRSLGDLGAQAQRPYLIWFYDVEGGYVYLFVDETRFGHYRLVFSTDPNFPAMPGWEAMAGPAALEDLGTYFQSATQPRFNF